MCAGKDKKEAALKAQADAVKKGGIHETILSTLEQSEAEKKAAADAKVAAAKEGASKMAVDFATMNEKYESSSLWFPGCLNLSVEVLVDDLCRISHMRG